MADVNVNTNTPIRFEAGGILRINDGTNDYTVINRENGSITIKEGGYEALEYNDRGTPATPVEGDAMPTTIEFSMKLSRFSGTGEVMTLSQLRDTTTGLKRLFTLSWDVPLVKGGTTKEKGSIASCWFDGQPEIKQGDKFDTVNVKFKSKTPLVTYSQA